MRFKRDLKARPFHKPSLAAHKYDFRYSLVSAPTEIALVLDHPDDPSSAHPETKPGA